MILCKNEWSRNYLRESEKDKIEGLSSRHVPTNWRNPLLWHMKDLVTGVRAMCGEHVGLALCHHDIVCKGTNP